MGASETTIGNKGLAANFTITTKALWGNGAGKRENILKSCKESLLALKVNKVILLDALAIK
jgi:aflatoxin B1 aldehyde reductase